jgi:hypothetical protein
VLYLAAVAHGLHLSSDVLEVLLRKFPTGWRQSGSLGHPCDMHA